MASSLLPPARHEDHTLESLIVDESRPVPGRVAEAVGAQGHRRRQREPRRGCRAARRQASPGRRAARRRPPRWRRAIEAARPGEEALPCPIVLLTSHTDPDITAGAVEAGVLGFLVSRSARRAGPSSRGRRCALRRARGGTERERGAQAEARVAQAGGHGPKGMA